MALTSQEKRIVIVGAGAAGLSLALALAERGESDVMLIDRDYVATASSARAAGIYTKLYETPLDVDLRAFCYQRLCDWEREEGLVITRNGFMRLAHDEATLERFAKAIEVQREHGVGDSRLLSPDDLRELIPELTVDDLIGAVINPSDGYFDGQQVCMTMLAVIERHDVEVNTRCALLGREDGKHRTHLLSTSQGNVECDIVVNAGGAWATAIGEILGAPVGTVSERHQLCVMRFGSPLGYVMPCVMDYVPGSNDHGLYFRHEGEGQLVAGLHTQDLGAGSELVEDPDNVYEGVDQAYIDELIPRLLERLPRLDDMGFEGGWAGIYPNSPDGAFIVGPCPQTPGTHAICGLDGIGVGLSPALGEIGADWIQLGEVRSFEGADCFSPARFAGA